MISETHLNIPVILGTTRQGRKSEHAARFILGEIRKRSDIISELIDIRALEFPVDDAGTSIDIPEYSQRVDKADAIIIVTPEYNHGYPGLLKHVLDTCKTEYVHKAVGIVGVSSGPFGGARAIEGLLPVLRALGLVAISRDINFGNVRDVFDESGKLLNDAFVRRAERFLDELVWMAKTLRYGRENIGSGP